MTETQTHASVTPIKPAAGKRTGASRKAEATQKPQPKPAVTEKKAAEPKGPSDREKRVASLSVVNLLMGEQMNRDSYAVLQSRFPQLANVTLTEFNEYVSHRLSYAPPATEWHSALPRTQLESRSAKK